MLWGGRGRGDGGGGSGGRLHGDGRWHGGGGGKSIAKDVRKVKRMLD